MLKTLAPACTALLAISTLTLLPACQTSGGASVQADALPGAVQTVANRASDMGKPALVVVGAEWCGHCKRYEGGTLTQADTADYLRANTVYEKLDFDEHKAELRAAGVTSLPTTLLFVDGVQRASFSGVKSSGELIEWIEKNAS
ncbi:MAG: thioredoxin family protein [Planctomycetota bacterium]